MLRHGNTWTLIEPLTALVDLPTMRDDRITSPTTVTCQLTDFIQVKRRLSPRGEFQLDAKF
jgi:hypothetical protein